MRSPEARVRAGAQRDLELMPKDQVLEREIPMRANGRNERMKDKLKQFEYLSGWQPTIRESASPN